MLERIELHRWTQRKDHPARLVEEAAEVWPTWTGMAADDGPVIGLGVGEGYPFLAYLAPAEARKLADALRSAADQLEPETDGLGVEAAEEMPPGGKCPSCDGCALPGVLWWAGQPIGEAMNCPACRPHFDDAAARREVRDYLMRAMYVGVSDGQGRPVNG